MAPPQNQPPERVDEGARPESKAGKFWRNLLTGIRPHKGGYYAVNRKFDQQDLVYGFKGSTWFKDIARRPDLPPVDESTTLFAITRPLGVGTLNIVRGTSNRNPLPTLTWPWPEEIVINVAAIGSAAPVAPPAAFAGNLNRVVRFVKRMTVKADPLNAGILYFTADGRTVPTPAVDGYPLSPGDEVDVHLEDLTLLSFISTAAAGDRAAIKCTQDVEAWF